MPLIQGSSEKAIAENIHRLSHEGKKRSHDQTIAIALSIARRAKKR